MGKEGRMEELNSFNGEFSKELRKSLALIEELKESEPELSESELEYLKSLDIYDSLCMVGSPLTRAEVTRFLETGLTMHGKPFKYFQDCEYYSEALELLKVDMDEDFTLTMTFVQGLQGLVTNGTLTDDCEKEPVTGGVDLAGIVDIYNNWNEEKETRFENIVRTVYRLEKSCPFREGNYRTGRLLMNYLLLVNGYIFLWINSAYKEEYLKCFAGLESWLMFHTNRILIMYEMMKEIRNGTLNNVRYI